ncbi:MAG: CheR family methyltransferase [Lachnospirales bacterium]
MDKITDSEFFLYKNMIKEKTGIHMDDEKKSLIYARLKNHLEKNGFASFKQYYDYIIKKENSDELTFFINRITTNHTFFNREHSHFDFLKNKVLPYIKENYGSSKDLRLWCAASSSGEEPYNLAFYIEDFFEMYPSWNTEILATDLSTAVLEKAHLGIYEKKACKEISLEHRKKYLKEYDKDNYIIEEKIKKKVSFRQFNLLNDTYPFKQKLQVIFCRNVMIYFDTQTKEQILQKMYNALDDGGYFFVSHSESLAHLNTGFEYISPSIYRKPLK